MPAYRSFLPDLHDAPPPSSSARVADRRDGAVYVLNDEVRLAVDVAMATGRPLLLRGEPGSGKSSLAGFIARNLGWRYYEHVVSSRTVAQDLLWSFDPMRKLADASRPHAAGPVDRPADLDDARYVEPGVMWWALNRESARTLGRPGGLDPAEEPFADANRGRDPSRAVVLIDEIDKADPDVPNGLLVPLGSSEFLVTPTRYLVEQAVSSDATPRLLVMITTNEERELPPAFVRRCVVLTLPAPTTEALAEIARRHLKIDRTANLDGAHHLIDALIARFTALRTQLVDRAERPPSTAEFLDALQTCLRLDVRVDDDTWPVVERLVLDKAGFDRAAPGRVELGRPGSGSSPGPP